MIRTMQFRTAMQQKEASLVKGMAYNDKQKQYELYSYCADYFFENYRGVFFADEDTAAEILQNSFIAFWENIEKKKIYVQDNIVMGGDDKPLKGSILTYFMGIARNKYMEWRREHPVCADPDSEQGRKLKDEDLEHYEYSDLFYDSGENMMLDIIADIISQMPSRCNEILTKFYFEEKKLEVILSEIPSIESKNALKTMKYKCMENLRKSAKEIYNREVNS